MALGCGDGECESAPSYCARALSACASKGPAAAEAIVVGIDVGMKRLEVPPPPPRTKRSSTSFEVLW